MPIQYHIYTEFNLTGEYILHPRQTIKSKQGNHESLILLEYSIFNELNPWLLLVDFQNSTYSDENHLSMLILHNNSAMISDFLVPKEKLSNICRFKEISDLLYDIIVYTDITKYDVKSVISPYFEHSFESNVEFMEWLNGKTKQSIING